MIALLAHHGSQGDWAGFAIVMLILLGLVVFVLDEEARTRRARRRPSYAARVEEYVDRVVTAAQVAGVISDDEPVPYVPTDRGWGWVQESTETWHPVDHVICVSDDCDQVLCYCPSWEPCEGAVEPGCAHAAAFVCDEHRLGECTDCLDDTRSDAGVQ